MSTDNEPTDQKSSNGTEGYEDSRTVEQAREPSTPLAVTVFCSIVAFLLALFLPRYLSEYFGPLFIAALRTLAGFILLFGVFGLGVSLKQIPELREFLSRLLRGLLLEPLGAFSKPGRDAWTSVSFAAFIIVFAFVVHLVIVSWFGATGIFEVFVKICIFALGLLAVMFLSVAADDIIVRPLLSILPNYQDQKNLDDLLRQIRKFVASIVALAGIILGLIQLFI